MKLKWWAFTTETEYTSINNKSLHTDSANLLDEIEINDTIETINILWEDYDVLDICFYEEWELCPYYFNQGWEWKNLKHLP